MNGLNIKTIGNNKSKYSEKVNLTKLLIFRNIKKQYGTKKIKDIEIK